VSHLIDAAQRRQEEQRRAFQRLLTVTADIYTDLHKYEPGEKVTGKLFINCRSAEKINTKLIRSLMLDKHVELEVSGTEKCSWVEAGDSRNNN